VSKAEEDSIIDRTLSPVAKEKLLSLQGWKGLDNPWLPELDKDVQFSYINLMVNPERYTGYAV
jgi:ERO1-like protein alpha